MLFVSLQVLNRDYDKSSDIWSAGVVLYVLLSGHMPFRGATDAETMAKVKTGEGNRLLARLPPLCVWC